MRKFILLSMCFMMLFFTACNSDAETERVDGGDCDLLPSLVYNGMYYEISEEITNQMMLEKYLGGSIEPVAEIVSLDNTLFVPDLDKELSSNFIPEGSKIYNYEGGARTLDSNGDPIPPHDDDDIAIVVVYESNGERVVIFRPAYEDLRQHIIQ